MGWLIGQYWWQMHFVNKNPIPAHSSSLLSCHVGLRRRPKWACANEGSDGNIVRGTRCCEPLGSWGTGALYMQKGEPQTWTSPTSTHSTSILRIPSTIYHPLGLRVQKGAASIQASYMHLRVIIPLGLSDQKGASIPASYMHLLITSYHPLGLWDRKGGSHKASYCFPIH